MRLPETIGAPLARRGSLIALPVGLFALVAGVAWAGLWGGVALLAVFVIGLGAELWRESARHLTTIDRIASERDQALHNADDLRDQLDAVQAEASRAADLEDEKHELEREVTEARARAASPIVDRRALLSALDFSLGIIEVVQRHRRMRASGEFEWPVTSVSATADGQFALTAHADTATPSLSGELVSIFDPQLGHVGIAPLAVVGEHQLLVKIGALPEALEAVAFGGGGVQNLLLRLVGLGPTEFESLSDQEIGGLQASMRETASRLKQGMVESVASATMLTHGEDDG